MKPHINGLPLQISSFTKQKKKKKKKKKPHLYYAIRKFREERLFIKGDNGSKLSLYPLINAKSIY
jgi:hypothetical protein